MSNPKKQITFMRNDSGNAEYFTILYGQRVRFDHRLDRWLVWDAGKKRWTADGQKKVVCFAKVAMKERLRGAGSIAEDNERVAEAKWCARSQNRHLLTNLLELSKSEEPISDSGEGWDSNPMLLGVANGILDLHTGNLSDATPGDRITKFSRVKFNPEARCPRFEQFMLEIFNGDAEMVNFIQRSLGYSITGDVREHVVFILYGRGRNGKSTLLETILHILGEDTYATVLEPEVLERRAYSKIGEGLNLVGARFAKSVETREGVRLNEERVKAWSGGDTLSIRPFYKPAFTFSPTHKIWLAFNHKPIVSDLTPAMWHRLKMIPFDRNFEAEGKADHDLPAKLRDEAEGILNWLLAGCIKWQGEGLGKLPDKVSAATNQYELESNPLKPFLDDRCFVSTSTSVPRAHLNQEYRSWCEHTVEDSPLGAKEFNAEMRQLGFVDARITKGPAKGQWAWTGLCVIDRSAKS